ncbi:MAG TPA: hypothetical protein VHY20_16030, partial [Pirellulales bacterium]|nr:hypothetical protein [Pirellulales bacterium]
MPTFAPNYTCDGVRPTVSYKAAWEDDWTELEWALADAVKFAAAPGQDEAQLTWFYGNILYPGASAFAVVAPLSLEGMFVLIEFTCTVVAGEDAGEPTTLYWGGRIVEIKDIPGGVLADVSGTPPCGTQRLICWGLSHDLDQVPVITTVLSDDGLGDPEDDGEDDEDDPVLTLIHRAVGFNLGKGALERDKGEVIGPNRSTEVTGDECYAFRQSLDGADTLGLIDAANYLLTYYVLGDGDPGNDDFESFTPWRLANAYGVALLTGLFWREHTDGRSTRELLNLLFNRRRALGWYVDFGDGDAEAALVVLFTLTPDAIDLGDSITLPANASTVALDLTADAWVEQLEVRATGQTQYDQVIARGERKGTVATYSGQDGTLAVDWSTSQQTLYNAGASTVAGYAALDGFDKQQRTDAIRQQSDLQRVYCWWKLKETDDQLLACDGEGGSSGAEFSPVFPTFSQVDGSLSADSSDPYWFEGLRLGNALPLYVDVDYSTDKISEGTTVSSLPSGSLPDFLPPIVAVKLTRDDGSTTFYARVQNLSAEQQAAQNVDPYCNFSCSVTMQPEFP